MATRLINLFFYIKKANSGARVAKLITAKLREERAARVWTGRKISLTFSPNFDLTARLAATRSHCARALFYIVCENLREIFDFVSNNNAAANSHHHSGVAERKKKQWRACCFIIITLWMVWKKWLGTGAVASRWWWECSRSFLFGLKIKAAAAAAADGLLACTFGQFGAGKPSFIIISVIIDRIGSYYYYLAVPQVAYNNLKIYSRYFDQK